MSKLRNEITLKRIKKVAEENDYKAHEIAEWTGLNASGIHRILTGETKSPRKKTLQLIFDAIEKKSAGIEIKEHQHYARESKDIYKSPKISDIKGVPYYNVDFSSGFDHFINNQSVNPDFYIDYEPYKEADMWVNNVGRSMHPRIENGSLIALKKKTDIQQIELGAIYAIVLPEMRMVKYIRKGKRPDHYLFVPENKEEFDEQEMPIALIEHFFLVLGSINRFF